MSTTITNQRVVYQNYLSKDFSLNVDKPIGCNLNNTPILYAVPTAPSDSHGTYIFSNNGSTKLLTAGGTNDDASVSFDICSSVSAPKSILTVDKSGLTSKEVTAFDGTNTSKLTTTGLLFNSTDYKSLVDTHGTSIETIKKKQPLIISIPIHNVISVFADSTGIVESIPESIFTVTPYSGFYYKNNLNEKVNWYLTSNSGMKVKDIKGLMLNFYNVASTSGANHPYVNVYTKPTGTNDAASWYKSRKVFGVDFAISTTPSTSYAVFANLKNINYDPIAWNHTKLVASSLDENNKGLFDDEEEIRFFSIATSSNSSAGLFEFILSKFTVFTSECSFEYQFIQK